MTTSLPDEWHIEHRKLIDYLLNAGHKVGGAKARILLRHGFARTDPEALARALLTHVATSDRRISEGRWGTRFVFEGPLAAPIRVIPHFRSVWLMRAEHRAARLITAYPFDAPSA